MAGLFALSVDARSYDPRCFGEDLCDGVFLQRSPHEKRVVFSTKGYTGRTVAMRTFFVDEEEEVCERIIRTLDPPEGIAYCGRGQGVCRSSPIGWISLCVLAEIINLQELRHGLLDAGQLLVGTRNEMIAETIIHLIVRGDTVLDGIKAMRTAVGGSYALLVLAHDGVYVAQSPDVEFPLVIGEKEGAVAVASEEEALDLLGFNDLRKVVPGEILRFMTGIAAKVEILAPAELEESCVV